MNAMHHEITAPIDECDADGNLNPNAIGWARHPHWNCNLSGRFGRKKKWDYWCFVGPERLFSVCLANIDYIGLCGAYVFDYASGKMFDSGMALPFSRQPRMPNNTMGASEFRWGKMRMAQDFREGGGTISVENARCGGRPLNAEIRVDLPPTQETLNVLVPWNARTFQFTSKQLPLAIEGEVRWGDEVWTFDKENCFGVRDFGRGIWPLSTTWNWAALSARNGSDTYGVNLGGQWTDNTGATENGLMLNGKFHPIADDCRFEYNTKDFMKPWRLHTPTSSAVDLEFIPFYERVQKIHLGILKTEVHQCFGHFNGTVRANTHTISINNALGWAEEQRARW